MIYKIEFEEGQVDYCTAKSVFHLIKSYDQEVFNGNEPWLQTVESVEELTEEQAKQIIIKNLDYDPENPEEDMPEELNLFEMAVGNEFCVIASSEYS